VEQASAGGEINVPLAKGLFRLNEIYTTLGEITAGRKNSQEVTIFDFTGVAIEDIAVAKLIYDKSRKESAKYLRMDFVEE
jgi:alanine dehydrogenase